MRCNKLCVRILLYKSKKKKKQVVPYQSESRSNSNNEIFYEYHSNSSNPHQDFRFVSKIFNLCICLIFTEIKREISVSFSSFVKQVVVCCHNKNIWPCLFFLGEAWNILNVPQTITRSSEQGPHCHTLKIQCFWVQIVYKRTYFLYTRLPWYMFFKVFSILKHFNSKYHINTHYLYQE